MSVRHDATRVSPSIRSSVRAISSKSSSVVEDGFLQEQQSLSSDKETRRTRVVLRSGSPKPLSKLSLRVNGAKNYNTLPQSARQTHPTIAPAKSSTPAPGSIRLASPTRSTASTTSLRIKSPTRQPWGAPSVRNPPAQQQIVPKRSRLPNARRETARPKTPTKPKIIRYTVDQLLAMRPVLQLIPFGLRRAAGSSGAWSEQTVVHHNPLPMFSHVPNVFHQHIPIVPAEPVQVWRTDLPPVNMGQWPVMIPSLHQLPSVFGSEGWNQHPIQPTHPRTQSLDSPIKGHSREYSSEEQAASVEDLETKIRSALSNRGRRRSMGGASRNLRSVRWDPSVTAHDSEGPDHITESKPVANSETVAEVTSQGTTDNKPPQEQDLPVEQSKNIKGKSKEKRQHKDFHEYIKNIGDLKKGDRKKLLQLLEAMSKVDSDNSSDSDDEATRSERATGKKSQEPLSKRLNPAAAAFNGKSQKLQEEPTSSIAEQKNIGSAAGVQQSSSRNSTSSQPNAFHSAKLAAKDSKLPSTTNENVPHTAARNSHGEQKQERVSVDERRFRTATRSLGDSLLLAPQHLPLGIPLLPLATLPFSDTPLPPPSPLSLEKDIQAHHSSFSIPSGHIPQETDHGREAKAVEIGDRLLKRFREKYPMTGNKETSTAAPVKRTHAAQIQQRLEYLLMEQKERKAAGAALMEIGGNHVDVLSVMDQYDKQILKKLKSEFRKEDMARKSHGSSRPATNPDGISRKHVTDRSSSEVSARTILTPTSSEAAPAAEDDLIDMK